jgi:hypothetical protein
LPYLGASFRVCVFFLFFLLLFFFPGFTFGPYLRSSLLPRLGNDDPEECKELTCFFRVLGKGMRRKVASWFLRTCHDL